MENGRTLIQIVDDAVIGTGKIALGVGIGFVAYKLSPGLYELLKSGGPGGLFFGTFASMGFLGGAIAPTCDGVATMLGYKLE